MTQDPDRPADASAGARGAKILQATRVPAGTRITLDGVFDEAAWSAGQVASDFVEQEPTPGARPTLQTEARVVVVDGDALYIAVRMYDASPDSIVAPLARYDAAGLPADWIHVAIDSYHDRRTAFRFSATPSGVRRDVLLHSDDREDSAWNAVWDVATRVDSLGWTAELWIPLSQLRFAGSGATGTWGIQFTRELARRREISRWAPSPPDAAGEVSWFGVLQGVAGVRSTSHVEVLPYAATRQSWTPSPASGAGASATTSFGADLRYALGRSANLSATINPDFGQVEQDPAFVNLTAYEMYLNERRPFFLEGSNLFDVSFGGAELLYSRRIGRAPQRGLPSGAVGGGVPDATRILGAAKLVGRTAGGWSYGLLGAVTAREEGWWADSLGQRRTFTAEPAASYVAARTVRDFRGGRSGVGFMTTVTRRDLDDQARHLFRSSAFAGALDARHRFLSDRYEITTKVFASRINGSESAIRRVQRAPGHFYQRPDATHLGVDSSRTQLTGLAWTTQFAKVAGEWRWGVGSRGMTPGLEVSDAGFQGRADVASKFAFLSHNRFTPTRYLRRWQAYANHWWQWDFGGTPMASWLNAEVSGEFHNLWTASLSVGRDHAGVSTDMLRGGPAVATVPTSSVTARVATDRRRPVVLQLLVNAGSETGTSGRSLSLMPSVLLRPSPRAELSLAPSISRQTVAAQFVTRASVDGAPTYVFGELAQRTASLTVRANYTHSPTLSLQLYGQPFVSFGAYSGFRQVASPRARSFDERFRSLPAAADRAGPAAPYQFDLDGNGRPDLTVANPDFDIQRFRSTALLRWEYRPGSTLFLVWTHGRDVWGGEGDLPIGSAAGRLWARPGANAVAVKASYWLPM